MRKLLIGTTGFAVGCALALLLDLPFLWLWTLIAALLTTAAWLSTRQTLRQPRLVLWLYTLPFISERVDISRFTLQNLLRRLALFCCALPLGVLYLAIFAHFFFNPTIALDGRIADATLRVIDHPRYLEYGMAVETELVGMGSGARVNLWSDRRLDVRPGDEITAKILFSYPDNQPEFDFFTYYRANRVFLQGEIASDVSIKTGGFSIRWIGANIRHAISTAIDTLYDDETGSVIATLAIGNRSDISGAFRFAANASGITHILSVSGAHVSILSGMALATFRNKRRGRWFVAAFIILNLMVCGSSAAAARATIMHIFAFAALHLRRDADAKTAISFSLLLLLLINPYAITDIGLQYSFASTFGLIVYAAPLQKRLFEWMRRKNRIANRVISFLAFTISCTLISTVFTAPLSGLHFGTLSGAAILSNILVLWVVPFLIAGGLLSAILFTLTPTLASAIAAPVAVCARYVSGVAFLCARLPFSLIDMRDMYNIFGLISVYIILLIWRIGNVKKTGRVALCCIAATLISSLTLSHLARRSLAMEAAVINVGQGQSVAATSVGKTVIIDCGGNSWLGAGVDAASYLYKSGQRTVDLLVLTHYHADHANGLDDLLRFVKIKRAALPRLDDENGGDIEKLLLEHDVEIFYVNQNTEIDFGRATATLYRPVQRTSENEQGISILLSASDFDMLVTGDLGSTSEYILLEREKIGVVEAFVAGHHGSRYSSSEATLGSLLPQNVLISVGKNGYGHPTSETLGRIAAIGAHTKRTDLNGTIRLLVG